MAEQQPQGPICQSCGMPMANSDDFGTNADGSKNGEYCRYCFKNGDFTEPYATMEQMIDKCAGIMAVKMGMPVPQAREMVRAFIPVLKRWKK